jgi:ABC-type cobalt transport system, ATPase component
MIEIKNVTKKYGNNTALNNVSFTVNDGEIFAFIGHNGAGKSTFARCLCGLEKQCKGLVHLGEQEYGKRKRLSLCYMVMQDVNHQLFTESTEEELRISMKDADPETVDSVLKRLDLESFRNRHPMALSGGEKQRVAIATALVSGREILVFDEPTSGLDLGHMQEVSQEIRMLSNMGKTVLVITHDYELIVSCCSHVLHLENGAVEEQYQLDSAGIKRLQAFFMEEA